MDVHRNVFQFLIIASFVIFSFGIRQILTTIPSSPDPVTTTVNPATIPRNTEPIYDDCVLAQRYTCSDSINGLYNIKTRTEQGYSSLQCQTTRTNCPGDGWTVVGSVYNGDSKGAYQSVQWTAKGHEQTLFNAAFWSANVTEVCLWRNGEFGVVIPVVAPSLRSLLFDKTLVEINSTQLWSTNPSENYTIAFTEGCTETGFNVGNSSFVQARIGMVAVNKTGCEMVPPHAQGIGLSRARPGLPDSAHGFLGDIFTPVNISIAVRSRPWLP